MKRSYDEIYAEVGGAKLRFDVFTPESAEKTPAVICIHGGGWVSGDKVDYHDVAQYFAMHGYSAFCPQYRLAPLYPYPAAVEDLRKFVAFLRRESANLNTIPEAVFSIGNSAGGHLSAMLAMSVTPIEKVAAAVNISGLSDLADYKKQHPAISWDFIAQFLSGADEGQAIQASPIYQITREAAPMMIFHGAEDDIVLPEQSERLYAALKEAGVEASLQVLEGEGHSFTLSGFQGILKQSLDFFDNQVRVQRVKK